jgi:hypothetical protein
MRPSSTHAVSRADWITARISSRALIAAIARTISMMTRWATI